MTDQNLPETIEECLVLAGTENEKQFFSTPEMQAHFEPDEIAYKQLKVIHRALNLDENNIPVKPTWVAGKQNWKYYPWAEIEETEGQPAAFVFSDSDYVFDYSFSSVGSRLCNNISAKRARYAIEKFPEVYKAFWF